MKVRESGMPNEQLWSSFFNIDLILEKLNIDSDIETIVEIGAGYGTFTLPVAHKIKGVLHSFEIDDEMYGFVKQKLVTQSKTNVNLLKSDVLENGTGLPDKSVDYVMLFNILHNENPLDFLNEAKRILKPNGKLGILHWRNDIETPRGPSLGIRSKPIDILNWLRHSGFSIMKQPFIFEPYHFGILASVK